MSKTKKAQKDIEKKTPKGYVIKVRPNRNSFLMFKPDGNPERLYSRDPNRILNPIKTIAFIGKEFRLLPFNSGLSFLKVSNNRIHVPYLHSKFTRKKIIQAHTTATSDLIPMIVERIETVDELMESLKTGIRLHYIVIEDSTFEKDAKRIKQRLPNTYIFLIKIHEDRGEDVIEEPDEESDESTMRATDIAGQSQSNIELYNDNPVFLARIFLRNLDLAKMKSLLLEKPIMVQDNEFIQALLQIMIRNDSNIELFKKHKKELVRLKSYCEIQKLILEHSLGGVREICEKEDDKEKLNFYNYLVKRYKEDAQDKEEEIQFWELDALINKKLKALKSH